MMMMMMMEALKSYGTNGVVGPFPKTWPSRDIIGGCNISN